MMSFLILCQRNKPFCFHIMGREILSSYLTKKVITTSLAIFSILSLILIGNQFILVLSKSIEYGLVGNEIIQLIFFKYIRDTPILISFSLFLGSTLSIYILNLNSEAIIFKASGVSDLSFFKRIFKVVLFFTFLVSLLSIFVVPKIQEFSDLLIDNAKSRPNISFIREGFFQLLPDKKHSIYTEKISDSMKDSNSQNMENVVIYVENSNQFIVSEYAEKVFNSETNRYNLILYNGVMYDLITIENLPRSTSFKKYVIYLDNEEVTNIYSSKAEIMNFLTLLGKKDSLSKSEIFWRTSIPISTFILGFISIFLGKTLPRNKRNYLLVMGVLFFAIYYNLIIAFKSMIANSELSLLFANSLNIFFIFICLFIYYFNKKFSSY